MDHIRLQHHVGLSVKTANLGKWFPPWTVTRIAWSAALKSNVSGISTDVVLFSEQGPSWSTTNVYGDFVSNGSLRGTFMAKLSDFTNRACAEARSVAKHGRNSSAQPGSSPSLQAQSPLGPTHRTLTITLLPGNCSGCGLCYVA